MADHQRKRIHPVDVDLEAGQPRPTAPLMPPGNSFRADKGTVPAADRRPPPQYPHQQLPPPPHRLAAPLQLPPPKRRHGCCCCFLCCTVISIVALAILAASTLGALYLSFQPKAPRYSVDRLSVSQFQVDAALTVRARFDVTVTAANPNRRIDILYERGSSLSVWYDTHRLAQGTLPAFYQGHRNSTVLGVVMAGQAQLGSAVMAALRDAHQMGSVPLLFRADVPVRVDSPGLYLDGERREGRAPPEASGSSRPGHNSCPNQPAEVKQELAFMEFMVTGREHKIASVTGRVRDGRQTESDAELTGMALM